VTTNLWDTLAVGERLSSTTFAGRETELDQLCTVFASLETSGARTVLVGGEAGIGKTRLIEEFRSRARAAGALIAVGVCTPSETGGLPYGPVVGLVRDLGRVLDEPVATSALLALRRELGLVEPAATEVDDHAPRSGPGGELVKTRLFETALRCLTTLAERSRVVIVFEDLHWADSATTELFDFLARNLADAPVMVVATYRSDEPDAARPLRRVLTELSRHRAVAHIELVGLDRDATAALMAGILGRQPDWALVEAVHRRSGGNPFFAEELTAARDATAMPSLLRHVIMLRVDRLAPAARHLVSVAAAAGPAVDHRILAAASDLDDATLRTAVAEAVDRGVLTFDDGSSFRFRHALQREAITDMMLPTERAQLHRRLATELEAAPELSASGRELAAVELATHWWEAGEWTKTFHASIAAGVAMAALLAMPEAYCHYDRALAACERMAEADRPAHADYVALLEAAADAAYFGAASERAAELARLALDQVDAGAEPERAAICHARLGRNVFLLGDTEAAFRAFTIAAEMLPTDPPTGELARVLAQQARCLLLMSRMQDSALLAYRAVEVARAAGARAAEGHALDTLGTCLGFAGHLDEGLAAVRDALAIAEELVAPDNLNLGYAHLSLLLIAAGRLEAAAAVALDGAAMGEAMGGIRLNGAAVNSAQALIALGRTDEAVAMLDAIDDSGELAGNCRISPPLLRMQVAVRRGDHATAEALVPELHAMTEGLTEVDFRGVFEALTAELALDQGRPADATDAAARALAVAAGSDDPFRVEFLSLALRAVADGVDEARARGKKPDLDKARLLAAAFVEEAEIFAGHGEPGNPRSLPSDVAFLAMGRAEQARLYENDATPWAEAAARWDALAQPYQGAYCRWREAEALLAARGERKYATQRLLEAWRLASGMGAAGLVNRTERLAQRARITLTVEEPDPASGTPWRTVAEDLQLTPREVEVLDQLARGRTDRQIADELFISKKTASVHVSNILRKLDVAGRVEAGEIGQRAGLG